MPIIKAFVRLTLEGIENADSYSKILKPITGRVIRIFPYGVIMSLLQAKLHKSSYPRQVGCSIHLGIVGFLIKPLYEMFGKNLTADDPIYPIRRSDYCLFIRIVMLKEPFLQVIG